MRIPRIPGVNVVTVSTDIVITRVANGWAVQIPAAYTKQPDLSSEMQPMLKMVDHILERQQKDPILAKLQGEDPHAEEPAEVLGEAPPIGKDDHLFVFARFDQVLQFLSEKFSASDGQ